jgi:DNA-binding LacI/PurR family transcriptional regulator
MPDGSRTDHRRRGPAQAGQIPKKAIGTVDLVLNPIGKSWAAEVLRGVHAGATEAGCEVVTTYPDFGKAALDWAGRIVRRGSLGVVLERLALTDSQRDRLAAARIPCVIIDPGIEPQPGVLSVGATNWAGSYAAAQHLVSLGHTRVAVVGAGTDIASRARVDGFKSALDAAGLRLEPQFERHADWTRTGARAQADILFESPQPPTAVFACSDRMASGVYLSARQHGLSIPEDVSVVGFDDLPEVCWMSPELTTVRQPMEEMGHAALQLLLTRNRSRRQGGDRIELSTVLVHRESTGSPRS